MLCYLRLSEQIFIMFYAHEVNKWAWPRVLVNVTTFTQFAQTASLLALKVSMHYNFVYIQ